MNTIRQFMTPYRLDVLSRVIAASVGGYVLCNLTNLALSIVLPVPQYQGLLFAMMISFIFYTLAIIWVFAVKTAAKAWLGLLIASAPFALIDLIWILTRAGT